jgi:hypothetical protein
VLVHNGVQKATQADIINITTKTNKQETYFQRLAQKVFLALIFGSLNTTKTGLQKVGCYSSSPLKQNLVPRFLSVEVRGAETRLELDVEGCSYNYSMILRAALKA